MKGWLYKALPDNEMVIKKCCLSFNRGVKYWVDHILNSRENRRRGALKAKGTKAGKNNRSLEKRPYPILSYFQGSADQESYLRNENLFAASSESMQRVTTVVSGRSVKCNPIFVIWIFAVVDLFSRVDTYLTFPISGNTMVRYEQHTLTTLFWTLKSDFLDVKSFEF